MKKLLLLLLFSSLLIAQLCEIKSMSEYETRVFWQNIIDFKAKRIADSYRALERRQEIFREANVTEWPALPKEEEAEEINKEDFLTIIMPNGTRVRIAKITQAEPINSDNCLLTNADIMGKVSYAAELSDDLFLGHKGAREALAREQHIVASYLRGAIGNYDVSAVLPKLYEEFYNWVTAMDAIDMIVSLTMMISLKHQHKWGKELADSLDQYETQLRKAIGDLSERSSRVGRYLDDLYGEIGDEEIKRLLEKSPYIKGIVKERFGKEIMELTEEEVAMVWREMSPVLTSDPALLEASLRRMAEKAQGAGAGLTTLHRDIKQMLGIAENAKPIDAIKNVQTDKILGIEEERTLRKIYSAVFPGKPFPEVDEAKRELVTALSRYKDWVGIGKEELLALRREIGEARDAVINAAARYEKELLKAGIDPKNLRKTCAENFEKCEEIVADIMKVRKAHAVSLATHYSAKVIKNVFNFIFGIVWLGPAMGLLSLTPVHSIKIDEDSPKGAHIRFFVRKGRDEISGISASFVDMFRAVHLSLLLSDKFLSTILAKHPKMLQVGNVIILNSATFQPSGGEAKLSSTSFRKEGFGYSIATNWRGGSEIVLFESPKYWVKDTTSLPFLVKNMALGGLSNAPENQLKKIFGTVRYLTALATTIQGGSVLLQMMPVVARTSAARAAMFFVPFLFHIVPALAYVHGFDWIMPSRIQKPCDENIVSLYIGMYVASVGVALTMDFITSFLLPKSPWAALNPYVMGIGEGVRTAVLMNADAYLSNCQDRSYKILTEQKVSISGMAGVAKDVEKGIEKLKEQIGESTVFEALKGIGEEVHKWAETGLLHFKAGLENQVGVHKAVALYYVHIYEASMDWFNLYAKKGCFRIIYEGDKGWVEQNKEGVYFVDKNTGARVKLADRDFAMMAKMLQELAITLIPNKIVRFSAGAGPLFLIKIEEGVPKIKLAQNIANSCLLNYASKVSGIDVGPDGFSELLGPVRAIYTDKGRITVDNELRFRVQTYEGYEYSVPSEEFPPEGHSISVKGPDLQVRIYGKTYKREIEETKVPCVGLLCRGGEKGGITVERDKGDTLLESLDFGRLQTIICANARIEVTPEGILVLAIYEAGSDLGARVERIELEPSSKVDEKCGNVPGIKATIYGLTKLVKPISAIQVARDGGEGLQVFETETSIYWLTVDEECRPIFRVFNKATGQWTTLNIIGAMERTPDGGVRIPTDKGDVKIVLNQQDGQPIINIEGPGIKESAPFLFARGPGGIWAYDPATGTWYALNGQDIGLNPEFAKRGLSFEGSNQGVLGYPAPNLLAPFIGLAGYGAPNPLLALPTHEKRFETLYTLILFLGILLLYFRKVRTP